VTDSNSEKREAEEDLAYCTGAHICFFFVLSRRGLNGVKLAYSLSRLDIRLLTAGTFNRLGQYASSSGNRTHCCTELVISFLAMAVITASTHFAYIPAEAWSS